jgi:putative ABC transport system permease protein
MREDIRFAWRSLRKSPTFTAVAIGVLAVGIGAATAIFSVVDAVVLRGLPFDEHDRLVVVQDYDQKRPAFGGTTTPQTYLDWRQRQEVFQHLAALTVWNPWTRNDRGEPHETRGYRVSTEFFDTLRVRPIIGRGFTADDEVEGRHRVVIISNGFWQERFGASADVLDAALELNEEPWRIVGVLPPGFSYPVGSSRPADFFAPAAFSADERVRATSRMYTWTVIGRLKPDVSIARAGERMHGLSAALDAEHPKWGPGRRARVLPMHEYLVGRVRSWMLMLLAAVGLVLLMACANAANLMLARSALRLREMGVRAALGASRAQMIRLLLVEGLMLSLLGAAIGVAGVLGD